MSNIKKKLKKNNNYLRITINISQKQASHKNHQNWKRKTQPDQESNCTKYNKEYHL
jgi:hypothetical protein